MSKQTGSANKALETPKTFSAGLSRHIEQPHNRGRLPDADGVGGTSNPMDCEWIEIACRLGPCGKKLVEARFRAAGCPELVAAGSVATRLLQERPALRALSIRAKHIDRRLGRLPELKRYCAFMAAEAARRAVRKALARRPGRYRREEP